MLPVAQAVPTPAMCRRKGLSMPRKRTAEQSPLVKTSKIAKKPTDSKEPALGIPRRWGPPSAPPAPPEPEPRWVASGDQIFDEMQAGLDSIITCANRDRERYKEASKELDEAMDEELALDDEAMDEEFAMVGRKIDRAKAVQVIARRNMIETDEWLLMRAEFLQWHLKHMLSRRPTLVDTGSQTDEISGVSAESVGS